MGVALFISAKRKPRGFDLRVAGKALAAAEEELSAICSRLGLKRPMDFVSMNPKELADIIGEKIPNAPPEQWFEPEEGLATVGALLRCLETGSETVESTVCVIEDLRQCVRVLTYLADKKIPWHFTVDI